MWKTGWRNTGALSPLTLGLCLGILLLGCALVVQRAYYSSRVSIVVISPDATLQEVNSKLAHEGAEWKHIVSGLLNPNENEKLTKEWVNTGEQTAYEEFARGETYEEVYDLGKGFTDVDANPWDVPTPPQSTDDTSLPEKSENAKNGGQGKNAESLGNGKNGVNGVNGENGENTAKPHPCQPQIWKALDIAAKNQKLQSLLVWTKVRESEISIPPLAMESNLDPSRHTGVVVVLGMHRSGTSMMTGLLEIILGLSVGPQKGRVDHAKDNSKGHFEMWHVARANDAILAASGAWWDRVAPFSPSKVSKNKKAIETAKKALEKNQIRQYWMKHFPYVVKDPRMSHTLPLWEENEWFYPDVAAEHKKKVNLHLKWNSTQHAQAAQQPFALNGVLQKLLDFGISLSDSESDNGLEDFKDLNVKIRKKSKNDHPNSNLKNLNLNLVFGEAPPGSSEKPNITVLPSVAIPTVALFVFRNPYSVAASLMAREGVKEGNDFSMRKGLMLWEQITCGALANSAHMHRIVVYHGDLIQDPVGVLKNVHARLHHLGVRGMKGVEGREQDVLNFVDSDLVRAGNQVQDNGQQQKDLEAVMNANMESEVVSPRQRMLFYAMRDGYAFRNDAFGWPMLCSRCLAHSENGWDKNY